MSYASVKPSFPKTTTGLTQARIFEQIHGYQTDIKQCGSLHSDLERNLSGVTVQGSYARV